MLRNETMLKKQFKFVRLKFPHFFLASFLSRARILFGSFSLILKIHFVVRLDMASIFVTYMPPSSTIHINEIKRRREKKIIMVPSSSDTTITAATAATHKHTHKIDKHPMASASLRSHFRLRFRYLYTV